MQGSRLPRVSQLALAAMFLGGLAWVVVLVNLWPATPGLLANVLGALALLAALLSGMQAWRDYSREDADREDLIRAAEQMGRGNFSQPVAEPESAASGELAHALERMRIALEGLIESCPGHGALDQCPILNALSEDVQ